VATNEATLYTLVGDLLTQYDAHEGDAELVAGWLYHPGTEGADHSLASTSAPTTISEAVTRLNDLLAVYEAHDNDGVCHGSSGGCQITNAEAFDVSSSVNEVVARLAEIRTALLSYLYPMLSPLSYIGDPSSHNLATLTAKFGDDTDTVTARFATLMGYLQPTVTTFSYSYLDAGGTQAIYTASPTTNVLVHGIFVDCTTLTQNGTLAFQTKIDGTNYRTVRTQAFTVATDDSVMMDVNLVTDDDFRFVWTEGGDEGAARDLPYKVSFQILN
jgi:hypothetical protein